MIIHLNPADRVRAAVLLIAAVIVFVFAGWRINNALSARSERIASEPNTIPLPVPATSGSVVKPAALISPPPNPRVDPFKSTFSLSPTLPTGAPIVKAPSQAANRAGISIIKPPSLQGALPLNVAPVKVDIPPGAAPIATQNLHLMGTMSGRNAVAIIEVAGHEQVASVGDRLDSGETVSKISEDEVVLLREGSKLVLHTDSGEGASISLSGSPGSRPAVVKKLGRPKRSGSVKVSIPASSGSSTGKINPKEEVPPQIALSQPNAAVVVANSASKTQSAAPLLLRNPETLLLASSRSSRMLAAEAPKLTMPSEPLLVQPTLRHRLEQALNGNANLSRKGRLAARAVRVKHARKRVMTARSTVESSQVRAFASSTVTLPLTAGRPDQANPQIPSNALVVGQPLLHRVNSYSFTTASVASPESKSPNAGKSIPANAVALLVPVVKNAVGTKEAIARDISDPVPNRKAPESASAGEQNATAVTVEPRGAATAKAAVQNDKEGIETPSSDVASARIGQKVQRVAENEAKPPADHKPGRLPSYRRRFFTSEMIALLKIDGRERAFHVGDHLKSGARVTNITDHLVLISNDGKTTCLRTDAAPTDPDEAELVAVIDIVGEEDTAEIDDEHAADAIEQLSENEVAINDNGKRTVLRIYRSCAELSSGEAPSLALWVSQRDLLLLDGLSRPKLGLSPSSVPPTSHGPS